MSTAAPVAHHETTEKPGLLIGASNTLTHEKAILPLSVSPTDDFETVREEAMRLLTGFHAHFDDRVLAGLRIRFCTNSPHLSDFWRRSTWSTGEWKTLTGKDADPQPALTVTAVIDGSDAEPDALSDPDAPQVIIRNTSHYGTVRKIILERVCTLLADRGMLPLEASALKGTSGLLLLAGAKKTGKTTLALLAEEERVADHPVVLRLGRRTRNGRVFLYNDPAQLDGSFETAEGVDTEGTPRTVRAVDFEADSPLLAFAAPIERRAPVSTSIIRFQPALLPELLMAPMENVPDEAKENPTGLDTVAAAHPDGCLHFLGRHDAETMRSIAARLLSSDESVALPDAPAPDPFWRQVTGVAVLSREGNSGRIVPLPEEAFSSRLEPIVDTPEQKNLIERLPAAVACSELINGEKEPGKAAAALSKIPLISS